MNLNTGKRKHFLFQALAKMSKNYRHLFNDYIRIFISLTILTAIINNVTCAKIGDYILLCKKNDPNLNECLKNSLMSLKPKFKKGIPEFGIPPLDPMFIAEVHPLNEKQMKIIGRNVKIIGISNFEIHYIKVDVSKLEVNISAFLSSVAIEGKYDVDAKIMNFPVKGKGPMHGNFSNIEYVASFRGSFIEINGTKRVQLISARTDDIHIKHYNITIEKLFPNKQLNDALNSMINNAEAKSNTEIINLMKKIISHVIMEVMNALILNIAFEDIFV